MNRMLKRILYLLLLAGSLLGASFIYSQSRGVGLRIKKLSPGSEVGKQYAVFIAINRYDNWKPLKRPVKDAEEIRRLLESRYYIDVVIPLYDEKATRKGIGELFSDLQTRLKKEDSLFIFYAGHGHLDKASKSGFWIPVDGGTDENEQERWLSNGIIRGYISGMKSKHIFLIADSCFSGDLLDSRRNKTPKIGHEYFKRAYKWRSRQALTSGASEWVPDTSNFARQLKLALEENDEPYLDPLSLFDQVRRGIEKPSRRPFAVT